MRFEMATDNSPPVARPPSLVAIAGPSSLVIASLSLASSWLKPSRAHKPGRTRNPDERYAKATPERPRSTAPEASGHPHTRRTLSLVFDSSGSRGSGGEGGRLLRPSSGAQVSVAGAGNGLLDAPDRVARTLEGSLRQALHDQATGRPAVRDAVRPGGGEGGLHRAARCAAPRGGCAPRARARGGQELRDPARRGGAHGAAQAHAA